MDQIRLIKTHFLPKELVEGILYVSEEYGIAGHLCPCGCKSKIMTPLGKVEWLFEESEGRPTLSPSIGNWQILCKSHYWIRNGKIEWSNTWNDENILAGQKEETERRRIYYLELENVPKKSIIRRFLDYILNRY